jgi:hypothetical protein
MKKLYMQINGSKENNIEVIRDDANTYTISMRCLNCDASWVKEAHDTRLWIDQHGAAKACDVSQLTGSSVRCLLLQGKSQYHLRALRWRINLGCLRNSSMELSKNYGTSDTSNEV